MPIFIPVPMPALPPNATADLRRLMFALYTRQLAAANPHLLNPDGSPRSLASRLREWFRGSPEGLMKGFFKMAQKQPSPFPPPRSLGSMSVVEKSLSLLGHTATDRVTGFKGMVASVCFDAYGCVQVVLTPKTDKDGKKRDGEWFDVKRLDVAGSVFEAPDFSGAFGSENGPEAKSLPPGI